MQVLPPHRATRRYTQRLVADPATVFPLLCPVREADWIDGWDPRQVFTTSGVAEPGCVFVTAAEPEDAVWMVTRHEPVSRVEMVKITPRVTACHLAIVLRAVPGGCEADITYTHTSLGPAGDEVVDAFTTDHYEAFMHDWEGRLNHYLRHGTAMVGPRDRATAVTTVLFETARLTARRLAAGDVDALLAVYGDREVVRWVGDGEPLDRARCAEWVEVTARNVATRGYGMVALVERGRAGPPIGFCGLVHPGGQVECELKYAFLRSHWGRGYATEAVRALLAHGAAAHGLTEVIATVAPQNEASQRVLTKAGLRRGDPRLNADGSTTLVFVWRAPGAPADV